MRFFPLSHEPSTWRWAWVSFLLAIVVASPVVAYGAEFGPLPSINLTTPQIASVSVGLLYNFGRAEKSLWSNGILAQVEPGIGGIKGHLAYYRGTGGSMGVAAWALKLSILHTYGHPVGAEAGQTYLGGELEGMFDFVKVNAGLYRHTSGDSTRNWLLSAGIGLGF